MFNVIFISMEKVSYGGIPHFLVLLFIAFRSFFVCLFVCLQIEGLWQPCVEQSYRRFFNSICSLHVSVHFITHILVILAVF